MKTIKKKKINIYINTQINKKFIGDEMNVKKIYIIFTVIKWKLIII